MPQRHLQASAAKSSFAAQGQGLMRSRQWDAAVAAFRRAIEADPTLAVAHASMGYCFEQLGQPDEAVSAYHAALTLAPQSAELTFCLGNAYRLCGRLADAAAAYERTIRLAPGHARAHNNLGTVRQLEGNLDGAMAAYREALAIRPIYADALANLGSVHMARNELPFALARLAEAVAANPQSDRARFNEGVARLLAGDLPAGWDGYEKRTRQNRNPGFGPTWDGKTPIEGRSLLVSCEQGLGDTLQCVRYLPLLKERGARVLLQAQAPLVRLLEAQPGACPVIPVGAPLPPHDLHLPLLSLPWAFKTRLETIPSASPYLWPPASGLSRAPARFRVGLAWSGNPEHRHNRWRSVPLAAMAALAEGIDATFISLQKECPPAEAHVLGGLPTDRPPVLEDFAQTADLVASLDLVISVDTAVAHLAGAMGKPVWILLPFSPDWRWLLTRSDSPWYPTATLFRQASPGDWARVFTETKVSLEARVKAHSR